jgi:hypothetical protein
MKAGSFSKMPATNYQLTWCHNREEFDLHQHCCENLWITCFWDVHWKQPCLLSLYCTCFLHPNFLSILDNMSYDLQLFHNLWQYKRAIQFHIQNPLSFFTTYGSTNKAVWVFKNHPRQKKFIRPHLYGGTDMTDN